MNKKTITSGEPVSPELLNELQNPSYEKSEDEVGHLPLPPDYDGKKQVTTIRVAGDGKSVDLSDWPYNAVVVADAIPGPSGAPTEYPENIDLVIAKDCGLIIVKPEIEGVNMEISIAIDDTDVEDSATIHPGEIAIITASSHDGVHDPVIDIHVVQIGDFVKKDKVIANQFLLSSSGSEKIKVRFDDRTGYIHVEKSSVSSDVSLVKFDFPIRSHQIAFGGESALSGNGAVTVYNDGHYEFVATSGSADSSGDIRNISYDSRTGIASTNVQNNTYSYTKTTNVGEGSVNAVKQTLSTNPSIIGSVLNKTYDDSFQLVDAFGTICVYQLPRVSGSSVTPKKTEITPDGIASYTHNGTSWVLNS